MFAKLLKHEFRSNGRVLSLLTAALLGLALMDVAVVRILVNYGDQWANSDNLLLQLLLTPLTAMLSLSALALVIYILAVQILLIVRFYRNKFTDEGYLTFTLPVTAKQIFWSSYLHMLFWLVVSVLAAFLAVFVVVLFGTAREGLINTEIFAVLARIFESITLLPWEEVFADFKTMGVFYLLNAAIQPFYYILIPMVCLTIGAVLAKKHKILAAFGIYYVINWISGTAGSVLSMIPMMIVSTTDDLATVATVSSVVSLVCTLGMMVGGYFLTVHLMKNKLNLP